MTDITMCQNYDCPEQDNCWRLNAPPNKIRQSYAKFEFDYDLFESGGIGCADYIPMDELKI